MLSLVFCSIVGLFPHVAGTPIIGHQHYTAQLTKGNDTAKAYLCFDPGNNQMVFGLPERGLVDLPVHSLEIDSIHNSIQGVISYFGADRSGLLDLKISGNTLTGTLKWHGSMISAEFAPEISPTLNYQQSEVSFKNGEVELAGTLTLPSTAGEKPVIIFIPGSGPSTRYWALYYAHEFASIGYASLTFDKRGCGKSTGSWVSSSLEDLSSDVIAASSYLESVEGINKNKIGLWGISQGGWIAGKVAASKDFSFLIVNSGGGVSPYEEEMYSYGKVLDHIQATDEEKEKAYSLLEKYFAYLKNGEGRSDLLNQFETLKGERWLAALGIARILPGEKSRPKWEWVATYDPLADIAKINSPALLMFGSNDNEQPTSKSIENWKQGFQMAGNKNYEIMVFDADHGIREGRHRDSSGWPRFAEGYLQAQLNWLKQMK